MASTRVCVGEKIMQPQCNVQDHFVFVLRMLLEKQRQLRALRSERQSTRQKRACARRGIQLYSVPRDTDLPLSLARAAEERALGDGWKLHVLIFSPKGPGYVA